MGESTPDVAEYNNGCNFQQLDAELFGEDDMQFIKKFTEGHFGGDEFDEEGPIDFISIKMQNQKKQRLNKASTSGMISIPTSIHQVEVASP